MQTIPAKPTDQKQDQGAVRCPVRLQLSDRDLLEICDALEFRRKDLLKLIDAFRSVGAEDEDLGRLRQHAKRLGLLSRDFQGEFSDRRLSRQEQAGGAS